MRGFPQLFMQDTEKPYWHDALMAFGRMSGWIVAPILLALVIGKWLDGKFHTAPIIFVALTGFSFIISIFGLVKEGQQYLRATEDKIIKEKNERTNSDDNSDNGA
jgi:F0F1-type ATP synthase assembly protein I